MADAETFRPSESVRRPDGIGPGHGFSTGDPVRVQVHSRSPMAGQSGRIVAISPRDAYGPYLVRFGNGLQFRYRENELVALTS
jgi:hypothetical protein